jgi:Flp pilus assembly protein TadG
VIGRFCAGDKQETHLGGRGLTWPWSVNKPRRSRRSRQRGSAMLELSLLGPGVFFLFAGGLDWGFYAHALIAVENAARTAALYTSSSASTASSSSQACTLALSQLRALPNVGPAVQSCSGSPVSVSAVSSVGPDAGAVSRVRVTYATIRLIPIPGLLSGQFSIAREVIMRLRG